MPIPKNADNLNLRAGEWVEIRSKEEILQTLDARGALEGLPFMPEMLEFCGQRFRVYKRADKTCDPAHSPWSIRRVERSVHLEGVRCNGAGHGECQAGCLIFWKENWLKRVSEAVVPAESVQAPRAFANAAGNSALYGINRIAAAAQSKNEQGESVYSCQATDVRSFTFEMKWWDPRQYIRDLRSGNLCAGLAGHSQSGPVLEFMLAVIQVLRAFIISFFREYRHAPYPFIGGTQERSRLETLDLQPGELVQVCSKEQILATLDKGQRNRGLWFDGEMLPYCGGIYRVLRRVHQIIDEKTGKMVMMKHPCIVLEGVVCKSDFNRLCPRAIYPYWRENWLRRAANAPAPARTAELTAVCKD
jgi:hypothetical protein